MNDALMIEINPKKRILKMKNAVCGSIITGTDKIRNGFGNGDCLYFDFEHRVFAVADGTERFPWASRDLLKRLSENLSQSGAPNTVQGWKDLINTRVYSEQKYQHKTTFSCVSIREDESGVALIISHGGDSVVTVINADSGSIRYQTGRDMYFAGRSKKIACVSEHHLEEDNSRVIISTDGLNDLMKFCVSQSIHASVQEMFTAQQTDCVCERIHDLLRDNSGRIEHDDIGFIIIDPFKVERIDKTAVLIGGTRAHHEKKFIAEYSSNPHERWVSCPQWGEYVGVFADAGIQVQ